MSCFRVIVHGVNRNPDAADPDGAGFYTAHSVQAASLEQAKALALQLAKADPRSTEQGPLVYLEVEEAFEVDCSEVGERRGYIFYGEET